MNRNEPLAELLRDSTGSEHGLVVLRSTWAESQKGPEKCLKIGYFGGDTFFSQQASQKPWKH